MTMPATTLAEIPGHFVHGSIGFVCDTGYIHAALPGAMNVRYNNFGSSLAASGRVPPLGKAPVAAWVLARLAALCGRRFSLHDGQVCGSDGDAYWLRFLSFSTGDPIHPLGMLSLLGSRSGVYLEAHAAPPCLPQQLHDAFFAALLSEPAKVRPLCIAVVYTSLEDEDHWKHVPYTLGWDGSHYVFHDSPEHTIAPEDYE